MKYTERYRNAGIRDRIKCGTRALRAPGALLLAAALLAASGCVKRELEYRPAGRPGEVEIRFTWPEGVTPASAHLHLYRADGTAVSTHEGLTDGYRGELPAGEYRLIVHNGDAEKVGYDGHETHHTLQVCALSADGGTPTAGCLLREPDKVYGTGAHSGGTTFTVETGRKTSLTTEGECLTTDVELYFRLSGFEGGVNALEGTLNGVSPGVLLCTGECLPLACRQAYTAQRYTLQSYADDNTAHRFRSPMMRVFGLLTRTDSPAGTNTVALEITDGAGHRLTESADVSEALKRILADNGGEYPATVRLEIAIEKRGPEISSTVEPWEDGPGGDETID